MPVATPTLLTSGNSTTNAASYNTASVAPASNKLILVAVAVAVFSGGTPALSVSGAGMTWDSIASLAFSTDSTRIAVFRSLAASPSSGALTITLTGGGSVAGITWHVIEIGSVPTSGSNGSGAIVQSVNNSTTGNSPNDFSLTLASLADASNNAVLAFFANDGGVTATPSGSYTELADTAGGSVAGLETIYQIPGTTTPGTRVVTDFFDIGGIAIEVAYAPNAPTITAEPVSTFAAASASVDLSVAATASAGSLTYQWQKWNGSTWANESGQTSATTTRTAPSTAGNADAYRVVVTDSNGNTTSRVASIIVPHSKLASAWGAI